MQKEEDNFCPVLRSFKTSCIKCYSDIDKKRIMLYTFAVYAVAKSYSNGHILSGFQTA